MVLDIPNKWNGSVSSDINSIENFRSMIIRDVCENGKQQSSKENFWKAI